MLPFQVLYEGKTDRCHPRSSFPEGFDVSHTPNHWASATTTVENVIIPCVKKMCTELNLGYEHMAMAIFDVFRGHTVQEVQSLLYSNNIVTVLVPPNCTDQLQPLDLSVNKPLKDHLRMKFRSWYSDQVVKELEGDREPEDIKVDMRMSVMKELGVHWLTSVFDYLSSHPEIIINGFKEAGIIQTLQEQPNGPHQEPDID